jgi:dephospho-CoA kinase
MGNTLMYSVGLTGGIASGKSTVAHLFAQHGVTIIDADIIAREVILPGQNAYKTLVTYFGNDIIGNEDNIDRAKLRQIVFNDPAKRLWLEKLLHPLIRERMIASSRTATPPYCIQVIPLLIETLPHPEINRILVIDVDVETQIKRLRERDHLDEIMIHKMLQAQISREQRLDHADDILVNEGDLVALAAAVKKLHEKYLRLAVISSS